VIAGSTVRGWLRFLTQVAGSVARESGAVSYTAKSRGESSSHWAASIGLGDTEVSVGLMARFSERMDTEGVQRFSAAMAPGEFIFDAATEAGTYRVKGARWLAACGGVRPRSGAISKAGV
jgi:hypothetical protein